MSYGPMIGLADLVRAMAQAETDEEKEAMAKALGYEKIDKSDGEDEEHREGENGYTITELLLLLVIIGISGGALYVVILVISALQKYIGG